MARRPTRESASPQRAAGERSSRARPFDRLSEEARAALRRRAQPRWTAPRLVAEVGFTEWTSDGKLRHPRFVGLRTDKRPKDVKRERPGS